MTTRRPRRIRILRSLAGRLECERGVHHPKLRPRLGHPQHAGGARHGENTGVEIGGRHHQHANDHSSVEPASNCFAPGPVRGWDLSSARIVWEARDQEPAFGSTFTFTPSNSGAQWVEAEAQLPDGRRVFAKSSFNANSPSVAYFDDSLPPGALLGTDGEAWNWVSSNPTPNSGSLAHQSALMAGVHQHYFYNSPRPHCPVNTGDLLYAWIYLDPANLPSEVMVQWNDGSSWNHRAYWGANNIAYGVNGTASQYPMGPLPAGGQWVQLSIQASKVGLEGKTLNGMAFTLYGGRATWDSAGRITPASATPAVTVKSAVATASRLDQQPGVFTFTRTGDTNAALTVNFALGEAPAAH